jgi:hypothetical protein
MRPSGLLLVLCENLQISVELAENSPIWYSAFWKPSLIFFNYCSSTYCSVVKVAIAIHCGLLEHKTVASEQAKTELLAFDQQ